MTTDMLLTALENVKMNPSQNILYINLLFSPTYNFYFIFARFGTRFALLPQQMRLKTRYQKRSFKGLYFIITPRRNTS